MRSVDYEDSDREDDCFRSTAEAYAVGYEEGYADGLAAALEQQGGDDDAGRN